MFRMAKLDISFEGKLSICFARAKLDMLCLKRSVICLQGKRGDTSSVNFVDTFSFSGDANPFVLRTFPLAGESPQGEGEDRGEKK